MRAMLSFMVALLTLRAHLLPGLVAVEELHGYSVLQVNVMEAAARAGSPFRSPTQSPARRPADRGDDPGPTTKMIALLYSDFTACKLYRQWHNRSSLALWPTNQWREVMWCSSSLAGAQAPDQLRAAPGTEAPPQ